MLAWLSSTKNLQQNYTCQPTIQQILNIRLNFKQTSEYFPLNQHCLLCADFNGGNIGLCAACLNDLPWHDTPHCPQCALPSNGEICGNCLKNPPFFDKTQAVLRYDFPADALIQGLKYRHSLHLAATFSHLLLNHLLHQPSVDLPAVDLIIPMPMHPQRLKERGFNQALEIARLLAKDLHIPLDYQSCIRTKYTPPQASLPLKERVKNMRGVFDCSKNLSGLKVAVVDDVMTSGASLNALAKMLKKAGAAEVECWIIARTL